MSSLDDILRSGKGAIPEEKLLAYLEGKLPAEEQRQIEMWLAEEGMESDALEGLQALPPEQARQSVNKLNLHLRKQLTEKKRKHKKLFSDGNMNIVAVVVILLLCLIAYVVVRFAIQK